MIPHPLTIDHFPSIFWRFKPLIRIHQILLHSRHRSNQLKRRARFNHVCDRPVATKLRLSPRRIPWMKIRHIRHRQNAPRRWFHHNRCPRLRPILLYSQQQLLLHNRLQMRVNRCFQRISHSRWLLRRTHIGKNPVGTIPPNLLHTILAPQRIIIKRLQSRHPAHLMIHIPQQVCRQIPKMIASLILLFQNQRTVRQQLQLITGRH